MAANTPNTHVQLAESILRDEYDRINHKIINLQRAHLVALRTLNPLPEDPPLVSSPRGYLMSPSLKGDQLNLYEIASIWFRWQDDLNEYCQKLEQAIKALEAMKMDIVKGLASRTAH